MGKRKRSKKFNISNRLAYTLIIVLSIVLLGIGVYAYGTNNPSVMGHSAGELNLDWGTPYSCAGTPNPCNSIGLQSTCNNNVGCSWGCTGGSFNIYCSMAHNPTDCNNIGGCSWSGGDCYGSGYDPYNCEDLTQSECSFIGVGRMPTGCYMGCSGTPRECSTFSTQSSCNAQSGCSWTGIPSRITNSSKGIVIPYLNINLLCDLAGVNCVSIRGAGASQAASLSIGSDYTRRISVPSSVTCPDGFYLSAVRTRGGSGSEAYLEGTCTPLPIR